MCSISKCLATGSIVGEFKALTCPGIEHGVIADNIAAARTFIDGVEAVGGTNIEEALDDLAAF